MNHSPARLFFGKVMHHRLRPTANRFVYPVHFCLLPLSRLEDAAGPLFAVNRWNLFSFHFADHGARDGSHPLTWIRDMLRREGIDASGEVWLQCFPRLLGFVFNPISLWFCHDRAGQLIAVLAEVNNTFGERHNYLLAHADGRPIGDGETIERRKLFHVSPFMAVTGHYRFRFHARTGEEGLPVWSLARIDHGDAAGDLLHTSISGNAEALATGPLLKAFVRFPLQTLVVVLRIHWQALKLWVKRVPFHSKPQPPLEETTR